MIIEKLIGLFTLVNHSFCWFVDRYISNEI